MTSIFMDISTLLLTILSITWILIVILNPNSRARKLPPGPFQFPIIGNILAVGPKPHRSLAKLSRAYGPVITLKLGSKTTIVVSSPETAKAVLNEHDLSCSSREIPSVGRVLEHDKFSMGWLPVESQWRKLRKICKEEMFSASKMEGSQDLRRRNLRMVSEYVEKCSETGRAVEIRDVAFTTSLNLISSALFDAELLQFGSSSNFGMRELVWGIVECVGRPNLADYFPILELVDPQGILKQTKVYFERIFALFDGIIDEKLKCMREKNDLVDVWIDIYQRDEAELSRNDIKHLLLDLLMAGTDTTSITIEWAMTELFRHPDKMSKIRDEIRDVIGENRQIEESDIPRLPYLHAVVKETFRMHPVAPFLLPHKAKSDVEINGYVVPKDAQILVNIWASGRDPDVWLNADSFMPERFLNGDAHIDYRGKDFELIPFGAGRRICPALPLAYRMVHLMIATLVGNFEWKLEGEMKPEEIDMDEKFGITLKKAIPLMAIPTKL